MRPPPPRFRTDAAPPLSLVRLPVEIEFHHAGEAHVTRPSDPASLSDADWADFLAQQDRDPRGHHAERWRHEHGCGQFFNCVRDTSDGSHRRDRPQPGEPRWDDAKLSHSIGRAVRIQRDQPIRFTFDGRVLDGFAGDTLASALLANGVHLVGRSFKYHRPRGIMSAGSEEPNALVTIDRGAGRITPNLRATTIELYRGLNARSQNAWPSIRFDLGAAAGLVSPLLVAGFYYKTFMWPASLWRRVSEPAIGAAAGLGIAPTAPDPDRYLHHFAHCDVLVIGGGPSGLAAAAAASARGDRVILCDEQAEPGGSLLSRSVTRIDGLSASDWIALVGCLAHDSSDPDDRVRLVSR